MQPIRTAGIILASLLTLATAPALPARAQDARIAAVVNDEVISISDLTKRVDLVLGTSNIPDTPESRRRVGAQVMRQMIDEKLELQEAKKHSISVNDEDVANALDGLEKQNNLPAGGLDKLLQEHHLSKETLSQQIRAQITWGRTVRARYGRSVGVGEEEVDDQIKQIEVHQGEPQNRIAEIFLSVDRPSQESEVREFAERLAQEIVHGASFPQVARQFSQSPSAAVGGDLGWELPGNLDPEVEKIVNQLQPGQMTRPQRLTGGYYIFLVIDRRLPKNSDASVVLNLTQVVFPLAEDADAATRDAVMADARKATADARSCGEMAKIGQRVSPELSGPIGDTRLTDLPADLRLTLSTAEVAMPTAPVPVRGGLGVFMVCRRDGAPAKINRDDVAEQLMRDRLDNLARRYLADLRRVAYIDLRV